MNKSKPCQRSKLPKFFTQQKIIFNLGIEFLGKIKPLVTNPSLRISQCAYPSLCIALYAIA